MSLEEKEMKVINKIGTIIGDLDSTLAKLEDLDEDSKKHTAKKWYEEKKALHEVKKVLHEVGKYEKYDEKELDNFVTFFEKFDA